MTGIGYDLTVRAPAIQALIIHPDATYQVREIEQDLATLKSLVGGYIEAVPAGDGAVMWCNEEGKIHGLDMNPMATYLWWKLEPAVEGLDELRGTVIVTGPTDEAGDCYPVFNAVIDLYRQMEAIRITQDLTNGEGQAP